MEENCCICGESLDPDNTSRCGLCGGRFHMKWSVHADMKECGRYILNEQFCTLMFVCNDCVAKATERAAQQMPQEPPQEPW